MFGLLLEFILPLFLFSHHFSKHITECLHLAHFCKLIKTFLHYLLVIHTLLTQYLLPCFVLHFLTLFLHHSLSFLLNQHCVNVIAFVFDKTLVSHSFDWQYLDFIKVFQKLKLKHDWLTILG